jgi:hypothetical protein
MRVRMISVSLVVAAILAASIPASVGAQFSGVETSVSVTDVISGTPLVDKNFTTDLQVSITNSGTLGVGIMGVELWVSFDPAIVSVHDFDGNAANGTQVEIKNEFFDGSLVVVANEVFSETPSIPHPPECDTQACIHVAVSHVGGSGPVTDKTGSVATITWVGLATGSPSIGIPVVGTGSPPGSVLSDADGQCIPIDGVSVPDIVVTDVGAIEGIVRRQGMGTDHSGVEVVAVAVGGGVVTEATTESDGSFELQVPLGGTYTVNASYPGYLNAHKDSVDVGGEAVDIGSTRLLGGDVNADNCINILDIVSIIADFGEDGLEPSDPEDINGDGTVNILDLTISAGNFSLCGPTAWVP